MWRSLQLVKNASKSLSSNPGLQTLVAEARTVNFPAPVFRSTALNYCTARSLWKPYSVALRANASADVEATRTIGCQLAGEVSQVRRASSSTAQGDQTKEKPKDDALYAAEEEFDSITDRIPEKPVTAAEAGGYGIVIVAALGIAAAAAYAVLSELFGESKEYTIFNAALERIQMDPRATGRLGTGITGYGSESRNRSARQKIRHKEYYGPDNFLHVAVNFFARGSKDVAEVHADMFKDDNGKWQYQYLYLEFGGQHPQRVILETPP